MYCAKCGKEIKKGLNFCPNCGSEVKKKKSLVERARENDATVWEVIYNQTYAKAYSVAIQIVKNQEDALDILQEAYISAFRNIESLKDENKIGAWMNQIVANRCKDWLRKNNPVVFSDMGNEDTDLEFEDSIENERSEFMPEESVDYSATKEIMQGILDQLSDDQRLCVLMYYYDEMSVGEIADTLECSTGTIKSRLNYARKYIKKEVEELEKKGTRLYSVAPLPFIVWMLRSKEASITAHAAESPVWSGVRAAVVKGGAGQAVFKTSEAAASAAMDAVASTAGKAVGSTVTVVQQGARHAVVRVVAGVVAATVAVTGGSIVYMRTHSSKTSIIKTSNPTKDDLKALKKDMDYDYLQSVCSYLPEYDSLDDITEEQLNEIYAEAFDYCFEGNYDADYHTDSAVHNTPYAFTNRQLIPKEQIESEDNKTVTFKSSAFDAFDQVTGIDTKPKSLELGESKAGNQVLYKSKKFTGTFENPADNDCVTQIIGKEIDEKNGELLISLKKSVADAENGVTVTLETVVVKPAKNDYGYQIVQIKDGYTDKVQKLQTIAEAVDADPSQVIGISEILGDYSPDSCDANATLESLAYQEARRYMDYEDSMITRADEYYTEDSLYSDWRSFHREKVDEICQLAGLDPSAYTAQISNERLHLTDSTYEVGTDQSVATGTPINVYLRTEIDPDKNEVYVYYLGRDGDWYNGASNFKKGTITLTASDTDAGYQIKSIATKEWNDEYTQEITEMNAEIARKSDSSNATSMPEMWQAIEAGAEYRVSCMEEKVNQAQEKYPEEKDLIAQDQEEFMERLDQEVDEKRQAYESDIGVGSALSSPASSYASNLREKLIEGRIFYIVGNWLMDDKIDILNNKMKAVGEIVVDDSWKEVYIDWVNQMAGYSDNFELFDLNGDGIPEISALGEAMVDGRIVGTYSNGEVQEQELLRSSVSYIPGQNVLDNNGGSMEEYYDYIYDIEAGKWVQIGRGDYGAPDNANIEVDKNGQPIYAYSWGNEEVSKKEYDQRVRELIDLNKASILTETGVSASEIIQQIQNY